MTHSESYIIFLTIATTLIVVLLAIVFLLWRRNRRMVSKVAFLFNAIDNGDYAFRYSEDRKGDAIINQSLNRIKEILQHARDEQIEKEKYFELILDSVDTGVLVVDEERGLVLRCNQAAHKLLNREAITHFNQVSDALKKFSVRETHTILQQRRVRIIAFSDIGGELANQEIDSWVRLIRVLTHEIMNTLTPVISLSEALLPRTEGEQHEGLEVIHRTNKDLIRFVENYRQFTHVPTPQPSPFDVCLLHNHLTRIVERTHKVNTEPYSPAVPLIDAQVAGDAGAKIAVASFKGRESVLIGLQPQRSDFARKGALRLHFVRQARRERRFRHVVVHLCKSEDGITKHTGQCQYSHMRFIFLVFRFEG